MKKNLIKAENELIHILKEIDDLRDTFREAKKDNDIVDMEDIRKELRPMRLKYSGMVEMLSIITGEEYNSISYRIQDAARAEAKK